jgi:pimeloyl-ACP methyl ester carboxylesterase
VRPVHTNLTWHHGANIVGEQARGLEHRNLVKEVLARRPVGQLHSAKMLCDGRFTEEPSVLHLGEILRINQARGRAMLLKGFASRKRLTVPSAALSEGIDSQNSIMVLFVHGLGGSAETTWSRHGSPGFVDLIRQEDGIDCNCFSYPTAPLRVPFFSAKTSPIQMLAKGLRTQIKYAERQHKDIVLVCHSLGGLIARWYILEEIKNGADLKVKHLVLFATPNHGAALAAVAKSISWRHHQLRQLCRESDLIGILNADWQSLKAMSLVPTTFVIGDQDAIVTAESASLYPGNPSFEVILGRGHQDIVKPTGPQDLSLQILRSVLASVRLTSMPVSTSVNSEEAQHLLSASVDAYSRSDFTPSYEFVRQAYALDPESIDVRRQYVRVCFAQHNHGAIERFLASIPAASSKDDVLCYSGELLIRTGAFSEAASVLSSIGTRSLYNVEYLTGIAYLFLHKQKQSDLDLLYARDHLQEAERIYPDHWWVRVNLMLVRRLLTQRHLVDVDSSTAAHTQAKAQLLLDQAIRQEPRLLSARFYRLLYYAILEQRETFEAIATEDAVVFRTPGVHLPKNTPYSLLMRLELLFSDRPNGLAFYKNIFLRCLAGGQANV